MAHAFLALGANLGDREATLLAALEALRRRCDVVAVSSLYETEALVPEGEPPGPDYLNAVCEVSTDLRPHELLRFVKEIEHELGRRPGPRWSARPIDIDILLYDDVALETDDLIVPHPRMAERGFVLAPLAELDPGLMHPVLGLTVGELAEDVDFSGLRHVAAWDAGRRGWVADEEAGEER